MQNVGAKFPISAVATLAGQSPQKQFPSGELSKIFDEFLTNQDIRSNSLRAYKSNSKCYFRWLESTGRRIEIVDRKDIIEFKKYLLQTFAGHTAANYFIVIKKFYQWLEDVGAYRNIARGIRGPKAKKGFRKDPLTLPQIEKLFTSIDRTTLEGKRTYFLLRLLIQTGLRSVELTRCNIEDVRQHQTGETLLFVHGKNRDGKDDFNLLMPSVLSAMSDYLLARGKVENTDPLIASCSDGNRNHRLSTRTVRRVVKESLRAIGLNSPRLSCHSLRHTAATLSIASGASVQASAAMLRHSNLLSISVYDHSLKRIQDAAEKKLDALLSQTISGGMTDETK